MSTTRRPPSGFRRRELLALAAAPILGSATIPSVAPVPMLVLEALEVCGTVAASFDWAFMVNACLGYRHVTLSTGTASGADAGVLAAKAAIEKFESRTGMSLAAAPGSSLVVQGKPALLAQIAHSAWREVRAWSSLDAFVLYAPCPDDEMPNGEIIVSLAVALRS